MEKLDFEYGNSSSNEQIAYAGGDAESALYRVRMLHDEMAENPFTDWDGHWPMIADYQDRGHQFTSYDKAKGAAVDQPLDRFTDGQIIHHQKAILEALGGEDARYINPLTGQTGASVISDFEAHMVDYCEPDDCRASVMRDYFDDAFAAVSDSDKLETMAALYDILRIPNLCTSSHGYCQGDYAELLIVATPEAAQEFGWKRKRSSDEYAKSLAAQARLYTAWAWGDVYGYIAERRAAPDCCEAWEEIDSCWSFYGSDANQSGLAEQALSAIAYDKRERRKARFAKLRQLITGRVPLAIRATILGDHELALA